MPAVSSGFGNLAALQGIWRLARSCEREEGGGVDKNFARPQLILQAFVATSFYIGAVCVASLSFYALRDIPMTAGDGNSTPAACLLLVAAVVQLALSALIAWRWKTARVACALMLFVVLGIFVKLLHP